MRSDAEAIQIGKIAAAHNITLIELRPADGEGLEELFLQLTAETQREGVLA
jgi:ABC-2 type transport system ATP-binding protein